MSLLKKPFAAFVICLAIVVLSTCLSVSVKLGGECNNVTDGFYSGELSNGVSEESIADRLEALLSLADDLVNLSSSYDLDSEPLSYARDDMQYGFYYSRNEISYLYYTYTELVNAMRSVLADLSSVDMAPSDKDAVEEIAADISSLQEAIRQSEYNDSVREYLYQYDKFPTRILGELAGVDAPEYFS